MNLKTRLLGIAAVLALSFMAVIPALAATSPQTAQAPVTVTLTDTGTFAVSIVGAGLAPLNTVAGPAADQTTTGQLCIRYDDTKTYRGQFHTQLAATDFSSNTLRVPLDRPTNPGQPYKISANNFEITRNFDVFEGRWSGWARTNVGYDIGDTGSASSGTDDDYSSGPYNTGDRVPAVGCGVNTGTTGIDNHPWTSGVASSKLSNNPIVGFGFAGPGTAGPFNPQYGSLHLLYTKLTVPAGQPADTYTSTLTVTVTFTGP